VLRAVFAESASDGDLAQEPKIGGKKSHNEHKRAHCTLNAVGCALHTQGPSAFMEGHNASLAVGQEARTPANAENAADVIVHLFPILMMTERTADGLMQLHVCEACSSDTICQVL
jgi:hypothetical protein